MFDCVSRKTSMSKMFLEVLLFGFSNLAYLLGTDLWGKAFSLKYHLCPFLSPCRKVRLIQRSAWLLFIRGTGWDEGLDG